MLTYTNISVIIMSSRKTRNKIKSLSQSFKQNDRHQSKKGKESITYFPKRCKNMKKINTLEIIGRRWFQKSYGNTYHTVTVIVNGEELKSGIAYGYGSHYLTTAAELLKANGYVVPDDNGEAYALMTKYEHTVTDVKRKKDL